MDGGYKFHWKITKNDLEFTKKYGVLPEEIMSDSVQRERPKVYVTNSGSVYVKADELLKSKRGRAAVNKMAQFFKQSKTAAPEGRS